uniref:t-SNARE coiled-coil homology domain-containing protein n=1 Tax=Trichuris muris TaxID=70415 RepID=A0A5S6PZ82_TRIMR
MVTSTVPSSLGALRSLTDVYIMLRNGALQNRHIFVEEANHRSEDRMTLIPLHDFDSDGAIARRDERVPPEWVHVIDEIQFEATKVRRQIRELKGLQQKHVSRPSFSDEVSVEEQKIEQVTADITRTLNHAQNLLHLVTRSSSSSSTMENFRSNVVVAHVQLLQQLTAEFQQCQNEYLHKIQTRESSYEKYFEPFQEVGAACLPDFEQTEPPAELGEITMKELQMLEENTLFVKEREREISQISKSIGEINQLFRDLASFVVDQGAVLDRIDCNVEQSSIKTRVALTSIKTAEKYQRKSRKLIVIFVLFGLCVFLIFLIIFVKS